MVEKLPLGMPSARYILLDIFNNKDSSSWDPFCHSLNYTSVNRGMRNIISLESLFVVIKQHKLSFHAVREKLEIAGSVQGTS